MGEWEVLFRVAGGFFTVALLSVGWWVKDLNKKHDREVDRIDNLFSKSGEQCNRITKLESDTVTETQVLRMLGEMERRISDSFKDFHKEFKEDYKEDFNLFKDSVKEIFKETHRRG